MARPVELIPLVCLKCSTAIPANMDEVAWVCAQCGQGNLLDDEKGLVPVEIHTSAGVPANARGKPFWVVDGQVTLRRETYSGNEERQAQQFWQAPRRFCVPAFACPLEMLLDLGQSLLARPPALQPGPAAAFEPVILAPADVPAAVDFIVMAVEAGRKDKLKEVEFNVKLSEPVLWVLP
jgi:hypothetical protein